MGSLKGLGVQGLGRFEGLLKGGLKCNGFTVVSLVTFWPRVSSP